MIRHRILNNKGREAYMEEESKERCPNCGSTNTAKIIWGLPDFTEELQKRIDAGELVLGGCIPGRGDYECNECRMRFQTAKPLWNKKEINREKPL